MEPVSLQTLEEAHTNGEQSHEWLLPGGVSKTGQWEARRFQVTTAVSHWNPSTEEKPHTQFLEGYNWVRGEENRTCKSKAPPGEPAARTQRGPTNKHVISGKCLFSPNFPVNQARLPSTS